MKAITLWQPHASWIAMGWKTIETRDHDRFRGLVGQRIAIHAGLFVDNRAMLSDGCLSKITEVGRGAAHNYVSIVLSHRGRIVCTALVTRAEWAPSKDQRLMAHNEWDRLAMCDTTDKYCLFLNDIQALVNYTRIKGRGIFNVPDELIYPINPSVPVCVGRAERVAEL